MENNVGRIGAIVGRFDPCPTFNGADSTRRKTEGIMSTKYVCGKCGGDSIQVMIWIDPNDPRTAYYSDNREYDVCHCEDCDTTTDVKSVVEV